MDKRSREVIESLQTRGFHGSVIELPDETVKFNEFNYTFYLNRSYWTLDIAFSILTQAKLEGKSFSNHQDAEAAFQQEKRDICRAYFENHQFRPGDYVPGLDQHEVGIPEFIKWAKSKNYILPAAIKDFLSAGNDGPHVNKTALTKEIRSEAGGQKGKQANKVKDKIKAEAIEALDAGCKCHNTELARFLMNLTNSDGTSKFILPGIMKDRYEDHFLKATNSAFAIKQIPLRNKRKEEGEARGQKLCVRPGHAPVKP